MDKLSHYRAAIKDILKKHAAVPHHYGQITDRVVCDEENDNYLWLSEGWNKDRRVHHCIAHLEIINGKIWIQKDRTEDGIALYLELEGIPKQDIVLGFHPADVRPLTEYAVA
ncbi:MAG: XisI protein [Acidobacteria bacterium]|nr:XisI protein [Acidobacteriota bacterium]